MKHLWLMVLCVVVTGCSHIQSNSGLMGKFSIPDVEAMWIQEGKPIEFNGTLWYPEDRFDVLLDTEVYFKGEYDGVAFFVEKIDAQPYDKIYTKFGRNKFRVFKVRKK